MSFTRDANKHLKAGAQGQPLAGDHSAESDQSRSFPYTTFQHFLTSLKQKNKS